MIETVCVFCGASLGKNPAYQLAAYELGHELAHRKIKLIYGGGGTGLMGVVAEAVLERGGYTIGVIPQALIRREAQHPGLSEMHVVNTMHQRKAMMAERTDAFIAMPGGFGTYEELLEIITWTQLGIYSKPIIVLNVAGFFDTFVNMVDFATQEGLVRERNLFAVANTVQEVFPLLETFRLPERPKWMDEEQI